MELQQVFKQALLGNVFIFGLLIANPAFSESTTSIYGEGIPNLDPYYVPHIEFGGYYFTDTPHKAGVLRGFLPIGIDDPEHLLYVDARSIVKNGGVVKEGNLGLGFRKLNIAKSRLYGCYAFYDRKRTSTSVLFSQFTFGLEHWRDKLFLGANLYVPVGKHSATESFSSSTAALNQTSPGVYNILVTNSSSSSTEVALIGADIDVGYQITDNLIGYLGLYRFVSSTSSVKVNPVQGPLCNLQYTFYPETKLFLGTFDRVTIENQLQYDSTRGTRWYAGVRFSLALGKSNLKGIQRRMVDPAFRDIDLVAAGVQTSSTNVEVATTANGTPIQVKTVTTTAELNSLIGDASTQVIAVQGTIANVNPTNTALATDQSISGGSYTLEYKGKVYNVPVSSGAVLQSVSGTTTLLKLGKNSKIEYVTLTMMGVPAAGANNAISADATVNDLGVILINNVQSNGTLQILRNGAAQSGSVFVSNSNFTSPVGWNPPSVPAWVQFYAQNNAKLNVNLQNSTFSSINSTTEVVGVRFRADNNGQLTIDSVKNNNIIGTDSGLVYANEVNGGTIRQLGELSGNYISGGFAGRPSESAVIIYRFGTGINTTTFESKVTNNTIVGAGDGFVVTNFSGSNNLTSTISFLAGITNNNVTGGKFSAAGDGFNIGSASNVTIIIDGMNNNTISKGSSGTGIRVRNSGTTINVQNGSNGLSAANGNTPVTTLLSPTINPGP